MSLCRFVAIVMMVRRRACEALGRRWAMQISIRCRPAYAIGYLVLGYGEAVMVERHAMAAMSAGLSVKVTTAGSVVKAAARTAFGGEQLVFGVYRAEVEGAWVAVAPRYPGDIASVTLEPGETLIAEAGSLLAFAEDVEVGLRYAGLRGVALREGVSYLKLTGSGDVLLASYGGVERIDLGTDDELMVDSGHLVAFSDGMDMGVATAGGVSASVLTGEGLVFRFGGPGKVFIQTRAEVQLRSWLFPEHQQNSGLLRR